MVRKNIFVVLLISLAMSSFAQDPHFSQFFASPLTLNPAFTGKFNGQWRLAANHREQWPTIPKAYVTTSASIDFPILKKSLPEGDVFGVGISGLSDASSNSILTLNYGSLSLSYHKTLDENGYNTIGAGFQGTYSSYNINVDKLTFEDELQRTGFTPGTSAEFISSNRIVSNNNYIDGNAGILYSGSSNGQNNYYLGFSMYHINRPKLSFRSDPKVNYNLTTRSTIHCGGTFPLNEYCGVSLSVIHQIQNKSSETVLGGAVSIKAKKDMEKVTNVYAGSWLRVNDALIPYLGLEIGNLRIGASYDFNVSDLKSVTNSRGGSEFSIIYIKQKQETIGIPCPRF